MHIYFKLAIINSNLFKLGGILVAQEIEIEYKNLLTEEEYNHLLTHLPFTNSIQTQTNHYFETKDFSLKKNGCALRIREKNGQYKLTLKEPHSTGLLETHDHLIHEEANQWMNDSPIPKPHTMAQLMKKGIAVEELHYYGSLITERNEIEYHDIVLVLDYSTYNGVTDYELELEASSEALGEMRFNQILKEFQIPKRTTPNKIQRFFKTL